MKARKPKISVIIIAHDQEDTISTCLKSALELDSDNYEVIVVDDCSQDRTGQIINRYPIKSIRLSRPSGPALARNRGAECACADILFFLDADILIAKNALSEILRAFQEYPLTKAVQGIYSQESVPKNIFTQYKDYFNNYKNQGIESDYVRVVASYCFAIKRETFFAVGKFDTQISKATAEDNDLGYRLFESGNLVVLNRSLTATHLKRYSFKSLLKRDYIMNFNLVKFILRINLARKKRNKFKNISVAPLKAGRETILYLIVSLSLSFITFILGVLFVFFRHKMYYFLSFSLLILIFILINLKYLLSLSKIKGWLFSLAWICIFYLDMLSSSLGVLHGGIDFFLFRRRY